MSRFYGNFKKILIGGHTEVLNIFALWHDPDENDAIVVSKLE